jgi:ribosomal protein S3
MEPEQEIKNLIEEYVKSIEGKEEELTSFKSSIDKILNESKKELQKVTSDLDAKFDSNNLSEEEYLTLFKQAKEDILKKMDYLKLPKPEDFKLEVMEVTNPEADAAIVAYMIAEGLEKRMPYRRVIKQVIEKVMTANGVQGARIVLSGRLGGAEIARTEELKRGSIPLQTLRADIDFKRERATLSYGVVGVKVWIYRGKIFAEKKNARPASEKADLKND